MSKPALASDDALVMKIRKLLRATEPRPLPTETMVNEIIIDGRVWARHEGWKCPICGKYCRRNDRSRLTQKLPDYSGYNMHFAGNHATPFWREKQIAKLVRKGSL